jgi:hypothetical protein
MPSPKARYSRIGFAAARQERTTDVSDDAAALISDRFVS